MTADYKDFGKRLDYLLRSQDKDCRDLAHYLNISYHAVFSYFRGESLPDEATLEKICVFIGRTKEELFSPELLELFKKDTPDRIEVSTLIATISKADNGYICTTADGKVFVAETVESLKKVIETITDIQNL